MRRYNCVGLQDFGLGFPAIK